MIEWSQVTRTSRTPLDRSAIADLLMQVPLFAALEQADGESLAGLLSARRFSSGQPIFLQGDPGEEMYLVLEGKVRISFESLSGRDITLAILGEGNFFGDMALLDGQPRSASVYAESACQMLVLRRVDFHSFLENSPAAAKSLLAFLSLRLRKSNDKLQDLALKTVRQRLAAILIELAAKEGEEESDGRIVLAKTVNHRILAGLLGTSRETISRMAAELRELNLVEQRGRRIVVLDVNGLREVVEDG